MLSALVFDMVVVAARAVFGAENDNTAAGVGCPSPSAGPLYVVADAALQRDGFADRKAMDGAVPDSKLHDKVSSWVADVMLWTGPLTAIGGPVGLFVSFMWVAVRSNIRIAGRSVGRILSLLLRALPTITPAVKWLLCGTRFVVACLVWMAAFFLRFFWGLA
ncbi:hypothetical protein VTJ83DRAFT_776 [Remersonia thermophila]|uniref:RDD domain-containing protein n=1 Tax=Remersonia thermophila TaxID=72144 RepID=A0ABR4DM06_9PEZI